MQRVEAESLRDRLQGENPDQRFELLEQSEGEWQVVRIGLPGRGPGKLTAERGEPSVPPVDPRSSLIRQIPPYGPAGS